MGRIVFRGADVIDGKGTERVRKDVLIEDGRIAAIDHPSAFDAIASVSTIDIVDKVLAPGFIDSHAHSDYSPLLTFDDTSKILQGVTTEVNGNCGFTLAPVSNLHSEEFTALASRIFPPFDVTWDCLGAFTQIANKSGYVTNFVTLMGHNTLRIAAMGSQMRAPDMTELRVMQGLLSDALEDGACGLSSGLIYPPGVFSTEEELVSLASVMPRSAVYASHMRNEGLLLKQSIEETTSVARRAGVKCHVSHLKVAHQSKWNTMGQIIDQLDGYRKEGLSVTHDAYPYSASSTMMTAILPPWMHDGGSAPLLARLRSREARDRARTDLSARLGQFDSFVDASGWDRLIVASTASHRFEGLSLAVFAKHVDKDPVNAVCDLLLEEQLQVTMIAHSMNENDVRTCLSSPFTAIGSDGLPIGTGGKPHPRGYGTFVRVIDKYVRQENLYSLEEAVRRMTGLPAQVFSIPERGIIAVGKVADIVVFDPEQITDHATFEEPTNTPTGIHSVWIKGEQVVRDGRFLGHRLGSFLKARM